MRERIDQFRRRGARYLAQVPAAVRSARGVLSLSFDDFPQSAWEVAGPILKDHNIHATYFVCGGLCDGVNIGKAQFTEQDLQAVHAAGHEVECHTYSHQSVLRLSQDELRADLDRNAAWVAQRLNGHRMTHFAYPFGDVSITSKGVIGERFITGRSVRDGFNAGTTDRNNLQAIGLESRRLPHYDLEQIMADTARNQGWLIAYGHDVEGDPTPYGCTPQDLVRLIAMAKRAGLDILPIGAAAQQVLT